MSELGYNLDAPVSFKSGDGIKEVVPRQVVGEEAMLAAFLEIESPSIEAYEGLKEEYMRAGVSPVVEGIRARAAKEQNEELISAEIAKTADGSDS